MKLPLLVFVLLSSTLSTFSQSTSVKSAEVTFNYVSKDVDGTISGFESTSKVDLDNLESSKFKGSVDVGTIKSGIFLRDWSLKGSKYFDADQYPKIYFESNNITATSNGFLVTGTLTIKNIKKSVAFDFKRNGKQLIGTTTLFSSDYGIHIKKKHEDNKVLVKITLELN